MKNGMLIGEMIAYDAGSPARINHFVKVYSFAKAIGARENVSGTTLNIIETAAILHDIGIKNSLEKYGDCAAAHQEQEGAAAAAELLQKCGYTDARFIDRVCWLIGHHHSYDAVTDIDHRILIEADFLVNLNEKNATNQEMQEAKKKYFRTEAGQRFLEALISKQ